MPVNSPTITIVDNGLGTGATVTVSGSTGGSTNTFYRQTYDPASLGSTWVSAGSRTGDGTIAVTLSPGHYAGHVGSTFGGEANVSLLHYFRVIDPAESVLKRALDAVVTRVQALSLAGVTSSNIFVRNAAWDRDIGTGLTKGLPAIVVAPGPSERQSAGAGTNSRDDVGYPIVVSIFASDTQALESNTNTYTLWRQKINRAFRNQALPGVVEIYRIEVEPGPIIDPGALLANRLASTMLLRCISREVRGL